MATDSQGRPVTHKNKVLIKYQLDQAYKYWVRRDKIEALDGDGNEEKKTAKHGVSQKTDSAEPGLEPPPAPREAKSDARTIHVYTDGASSGNPGPSGIGVLLQYGPHEREISRYIGEATNNIAELLAVKTALESIKRKDFPVRLYTDSSYVHGLLSKGWKANKNKALVNEIRMLYRQFPDLKLIKVKGHAGNEGNVKADRLATDAIKNNTP
ncbi:MAG: ribonuclease HI [Desulfobacterales bacterium]|nr:ribonuclease HI [Desulfobacterales bacterium]